MRDKELELSISLQAQDDLRQQVGGGGDSRGEVARLEQELREKSQLIA